MMEGGLLDGDQRDRQRFLEAKRAKGELLSGADLRESIKAEAEVKPYVVKKSALTSSLLSFIFDCKMHRLMLHHSSCK